MPKRRQIIEATGEPTKKITPPVIVTADGEPVVHQDAVTQNPVSVTTHVITGDVDPDATDNGVPQVQNVNEVIDDEQAAQDVTQLFSFSNVGNGGDYQADMPKGQGVWHIGMGSTTTTTGTSTNAIIVPYNTTAANGLWLVIVTDSTYYFEVEINNYSAFQYQAAEFDLY